MKFLHAADLHLDSPMRGLAKQDESPIAALQGATRQAFGNLVDLAIDENVDFVLLAGDLYDGSWQDFSTAIFLAKKLGELGKAGIKVYGVLGNHDAQSKLTRPLEKPNNLTLFPANAPSTEILEHLGVAIHGQSFERQHVEDNLAAGFPAKKPGMFNIGLLHTSLDGREGHANYAPCKLDDLLAKDYNYWALGHVHAAEEVSRDPWVVFPGCLQGRHVRESGPKGCYLVSVEDGQIDRVEHRVLDVVRWATRDIDLSKVDSLHAVLDITGQALAEILEAAGDRIVAARLRFVGASPVHADLQGQSNWLRQKLLEHCAEHYGDGLWIEKVVIATTSQLDRNTLLAGDGAMAELARSILDLQEEPAAVRGLEAALASFSEKLPAEALVGEQGLQLNQPKMVAQLIREAKELLLSKLLETGAE